MDPTGWLSFLEEIAERADEIALRLFRAPRLRVEEKPDLSPVTEADRAIEETARGLCARRHPELSITGEEFGAAPAGPGPRLIIDPIDGTRNFVRGIPIFATLLAVEDSEGLSAGLVSAPALGARWSAARRHGAYSGSRRIRVSAVRSMDHALLLHSSIGGRAERTPPPGFTALAARVERTRGFGDFYQHVIVAEGAAEIAVDPSVSLWDVAPLILLVEEAGGRATTLEGRRDPDGRSLLSTNGILHEEVVRLLAAESR